MAHQVIKLPGIRFFAVKYSFKSLHIVLRCIALGKLHPLTKLVEERKI